MELCVFLDVYFHLYLLKWQARTGYQYFVVPRRLDMCFVHKARFAYFVSFYDERTCADNGFITHVRPGKRNNINDPDPQCTAHLRSSAAQQNNGSE